MSSIAFCKTRGVCHGIYGGAGVIARLEGKDPVKVGSISPPVDSAVVGDASLSAGGGEGPEGSYGRRVLRNPLFNAGSGATCAAAEEGSF